MRLHLLTLEAFGPFPNMETIDFDALTSDGLFLLHGRTGSGKTSVLDAVSFALYGDVPGHRDIRGLRSLHAPRGAEPAVELEFSIGRQRYRVRRTPAYSRPSRRKKGEIVQVNQRAMLSVEEGSAWRELAHGAQAVGKELSTILPLDREQFTRVILLPQGEFAQFLHAPSTEKQQLLQKLFDTTRYQQLEHELRDQAQVAKKQVEEAEYRVSSRADAVREAAAVLLGTLFGRGDEPEDDQPSQRSAVEALSQLSEERLGEVATVLARWHRRGLEQDAGAAAEQAETSEERAASLRRRRELLSLYGSHRYRQQAHQAQGQDVAVLRERLQQHRTASEISEWFDHVTSVAKRHEAAEDQANREIRAAREALASQADVASRSLQEASAELDAARNELAELRGRLTDESAQALEAEQRDLLEELGRAHRQQSRFADEIKQLQVQIDAVEKDINTEQKLLIDPEETTERLQELTRTQHTAQRQLELLESWGQNRDRLQQAEEAMHRTAERVRSAEQRHRELLQQYLNAVAARLAGDLEEGQACMVCGATEHPSPARPAQETVQEEDVQEAAEARQESAASASRAEARYENLTVQLSELETALADTGLADPDEISPGAVRERCTQREAEAEELENALRQDTARRKRLDQLREKLADLREEHTALNHAQLKQTEEQHRLTERQKELDEQLTTLRGEHSNIQQRVQALNRLEEKLVGAGRALQQLNSCEEQLEHARQEAQKRLDTSDFGTVEELRSALLQPSARAEAEEAISAWEREAQRLTIEAESEDYEAARRLAEEGVEAPDEEEVLEAEEQAQHAQAQARAAAQRLQSHTARETDLGTAVTRLEAALRARAGQLAEQKLKVDLAEVVGGTGAENTRKMSLTSYVLAARLERVALAATRHLMTMSEGRYQLLHDDEARGRGRQGLELKVHDEHSDHDRSTSSLSGGETFMASLAMALGLAEVVQSDAGGIELETLFIDEGFGSLDEESLEHVMAALSKLQGEGRRIGVVSHVTEMHRAIPTQLRIQKRRNGSTTTMVLPDRQVIR